MADAKVPVEGSTVASDSKPLERTPKFADYLRIFSYATKWDFVVYVIASLASIGAGITMPLMNVIFGKLVGDFTDYFKDASNISTQDFKGTLNKQALYIMALFLGRWGLNAINKFCFRMIGIRLSSAIRLHYLQSLLAQSIHVIDSMPNGAAATAITATSNTLQLGISERLATFLQFNATIWSAIIIAFVWSWQLTLVTSSVLVFILVVLSITLPVFIKTTNAAGEADSHATAIASEALEGIRLVMACGAQTRIVSQYQKWIEEASKRSQKAAPAIGAQLGLIFFAMFGAFGLAFWYGTQRYIDGAMSNVGTIIVVLMSVMMVLSSMERIATPLIAVSKAMVAACELFTVIDAPLPVSGSLKPDITSEDLVFEDVVFEYPSRPGVRVLDGLSLRIKSGQNTALVGPSGSGKSTIVGLLERWYSLKTQCILPKVVEDKKGKNSPEEKEKENQDDQNSETPIEPKLSGSITVGGQNLEDLDLQWWRSQIGLVQQEPFLFNGTIFANVCNGLIGTKWVDETEERKRELVQEACKEAYAHDFISRLPDGYDTQVGDGGVKLSGGQKQRLAIARSIVKKPQIIILDEATSAIDAKSEKLVQAALDRVTQTRTTITIAHRLSTIKKADQIIVLQRGRAVENGTHESLMSDPSGVYSALVRAQALNLPGTDGTESDIVPTELEFDSEKPVKHVHHHVDDSTQSLGSTEGNTPKRSRNAISVLATLLYRQRARWPLHLSMVLSAMAVGAGTPIQAWLFAKVIGVFLLKGDDLRKEGDFWGLMWLALAGGVGVAYLITGWSSLWMQHYGSALYKTQYFKDIIYQRLGFFDKDGNSHGTLTSQIGGDVKHIEEIFGLNSAFVLSGVFNVLGCITISLIFSWKLGLVAMFVTLPIMLGAGFWKFRHELQFDQMNSAVFAESSQFATEAIGAIRTVSSLTMEPTINSRYQKLLDGHVQDALRKAQWTSVLFGFADSAGLGCQALIFWYGGRLMANGELGMEAFFVCFMGMIQGAEAASQVLALAPNAAQASAAANRILDIQEAADFERSRTGHIKNIPDTDGGVEIELRDVYFQYPTRGVPVFEGLNLTIKKGQFAAFVGPSGCGKTTIISLLERFYDPVSEKGAILCNGTNINDLNVYDYRQHLSLVAQEPTLFRGTVRDNILFGIDDPSSVSDEKIEEVCRAAFIHDFIISLPEGYNTDVGNKGVSMSGGQKQRVAIARALIRDPKILLLDEATSALDSESEKIVQAAFEKARDGRTMIAVAHRLSTIQDADVIFVFDDGRVVEKGTHSELVKKQGVYWEMCQSQALDQ